MTWAACRYCRSPHRCELQCKRARPVVLVEIDPLVDRVRLVLPCAEGHGRNTVAGHPVRLGPALRGGDAGRSADGGPGRDRAFDHRQAVLDADRIVVGLGLELDTARLALAAF